LDGALFDPLIRGETVGERIGSTTFIPGKGLMLNSVSSFVRYRLPRAVVSGEYSMDVEALRLMGPGTSQRCSACRKARPSLSRMTTASTSSTAA